MQDMMPLFKQALERWAGYLRMETGATEFKVEPHPNGDLTLVLVGPWGTHRKLFSRKLVWGTTTRLLPSGARMTKRTCDFVRDVISEVNEAKENAVYASK
jgi:hypothetical protein